MRGKPGLKRKNWNDCNSANGLKFLAENHIDAYIPDNGYRQRDERYAEQDKHKAKPDPLCDKSANKSTKADQPRLFKPKDFQFRP